MFPALVNCCTIDWFLTWPSAALKSVAEHFLADVEDLPSKDGIVSICVDMQERVRQLTDRYLAELQRYYYVTPTSYLILIKTFTSLLASRRKMVDNEIFKFERGLSQLQRAEKDVGVLRVELEVLIPELKVKADESAVMQKDIEVQKKHVDKEAKIAA